MATKDQYEFFKYIYEREERRYDRLIERGKTLLAIVPFYGAFVIFTTNQQKQLMWFDWFIFAGACFFFACIVVVNCIGSRHLPL